MQDALSLFSAIDGMDYTRRRALASGGAMLGERRCGYEQRSEGLLWCADVLASDASLDVDAWQGTATTPQQREER